MSGRRLTGTTAAMGAIAVALALLAPPVPEMTAAVTAGQRTADSAGAEALVLAVTGLLAWAVWAWGALGLLLTAASALPGALGATAVLLTRVVLPGAARRSAALALGIGLGVAGPAAGTALLVVTAPAAAAAPGAVPDWPAASPATVPGAAPAPSSPVPSPTSPTSAGAAGELPDRPEAPDPTPAGSHVVLRGECLWDIAAGELGERLGRAPSVAEIARATRAWWLANAAVIGADPDVLLPGQVLRPPP